MTTPKGAPSNNVPTFATVFPGKHHAVDQRFVGLVRKAEGILNRRVLCVVHSYDAGERESDMFSPRACNLITDSLREHPKGTPIAVLLHSPGGDAHAAFRLARAINRQCGSYSVVIPRYAKSAATLFALGATEIYFGDNAELGPIDVQIDDLERERQISALETVQSLERLNSEAMQVVDTMMSLLLNRTGKKIDSLLPHVLKYAADVTRPIFEKIDTVAFTFHARLLKIGEDYAKLLLSPRFGPKNAEVIAYSLSRKYPDHGFSIDFEQAEEIGLELQRIPDTLGELLAAPLLSYTKCSVLGFLEEDHAAKANQNQAKNGGTAAVPQPSGSPHRNRNPRRTRNRISEN